MKTLNILIADDHEVVRAGVCALLRSREGWNVVGEAANGREAVAMAEKLKPDIVIIDFSMPELNGLEATRQIKRILPEVEVLVLTAADAEQVIRDVLAAGARAYLPKADSGKHLIDAVAALAEHKPFLGGAAAHIVFEAYVKGPSEPGEAASPLTAREREIIQLLAEGKSSKEVAAVLGISVRTAETHRANIMTKLGLKSFSDLVRYAIRNKIVEA